MFKKYPITAFKDNPMIGIQDKIQQSIRELDGKIETLEELLAFKTLQKLIIILIFFLLLQFLQI